MQNKDIREEVGNAGLKLWEIAYALGVTDATFSRKLRRELSNEDKSRIRSIIERLKGRDQNA